MLVFGLKPLSSLTSARMIEAFADDSFGAGALGVQPASASAPTATPDATTKARLRHTGFDTFPPVQGVMCPRVVTRGTDNETISILSTEGKTNTQNVTDP